MKNVRWNKLVEVAAIKKSIQSKFRNL